MKGVVLLRHAATEWSGLRFCGRTDLPLSEVGRAQVSGLNERVAGARLAVDVVRSSPARRARETAEPLARALGTRLELDDRLREVDFGLVEGCGFGELVRVWPQIARALLDRDTAIDWPEGERSADIVQRLRPVVEELEGLEGRVLLVTHGVVISVLLTLLGIAGGVAADLAPAQFLVLERRTAWHLVDASAPADHAKEGVSPI